MTQQLNPKIMLLGCKITNADIDKGIFFLENPAGERVELRCTVTPQIMVDGNITHVKGVISFNIVAQDVLESESEGGNNVPS